MPQNQIPPDGRGALRDPRIDRIVRLAARALGAPAAAHWNEIGDRFHLASWHGITTVGPPLDGLPLDVHGPLLLADLALAAPAAAAYPFTVPSAAPPLGGELAEQRVRGYAVAPISNPSGRRAGVLAILDVAPRVWSAADGEVLLEHAALIGEVVQLPPTTEPGGEQYRALLRNFPDGAVALFDHDLRCTLADGPELSRYGISLVGKTIWETFSAERVVGLERILREALRGGSRSEEVPFGDDVFQLRAVPVRAEDGTIMAAMTMLQNVTTRVSAQAALRASESRYRQLFANAGEAIYILQADGGAVGAIVEANAAAAAMHGYTLPEILSRTQMDLVAPALAPRTPGSIRRLGQGEWIKGETVHVRRDGTTFPVEFTAGPHDIDGQRCVLTFARDITERKQAEEALRKANRAADAANDAKSAFLANMSHEIRTPLHAILGHTQLLQRDAELGASQQLQLEVIRGSGEQLLSLMNDVLEMSRMEVGRRQLRPIGIDLWRLLDDLDRVFGAQAAAKRLTFLTVRSPDLPRHILADGGKLEQMLGALLRNAVKFTEHGTVTMRALLRRVGVGAPRMVIEVEDTGTGIGAERLDALFHPFAQTRVGIVAQGGVGLGLAISQEIARSMEGEIAVESRVGQGSVFRLEIPIEVISTPAPEAPAPLGRVRGIVGSARLLALVVSGGRAQRSWMGLLLEQVGFDVREEHHGPQVLEQLDAWHPHLVLMDVRAPAAAATATTRAIRARPGRPPTIIVALASHTFDEDRYRLTEAGADGVLRRPCREGDLLEEVRARLGIQYTYSEAPPSDRAEAIPSLLVMRQELRRLPAPRVEELRAAAHIADSERLTSLVAQLPDQASPVTRALRVLVEQYAYDQIEAVLVDEPPPAPRSAP